MSAIWDRVNGTPTNATGLDYVIVEAWALMKELPALDQSHKIRAISAGVELIRTLPRETPQGQFGVEVARRVSA